MKNNPNLMLAILLLLIVAVNYSNSETNQTGQTYAPSLKNSSSPVLPTSVSNTPAALKSNSAKSAWI